MTERGPRTQDLAEGVQELRQEIKDLGKNMTDLRADLAEFRVEVAEKFGQLGSDLRTDLGKFQGEVKSDLRWIKTIGASLLGIGLAFAGWVTWDIASLTAGVRNQEKQQEKVERRLDGIDAKLDALLRRVEPKPEGKTKAEGNGE